MHQFIGHGGFFFLKNQLKDFTTPPILDKIINLAMKFCETEREKTQLEFEPIFEFNKIDDEKIRAFIVRPTPQRTVIGCIDLIKVIDETGNEQLTLDGGVWSVVVKKSHKDLSAKALEYRLNLIVRAIPPMNFCLLQNFISTISATFPEGVLFDLNLTYTGIELSTKLGNKIFSRLFVLPETGEDIDSSYNGEHHLF